MKIAVFTLTYNRLDLTIKTVQGFRENSPIDYHLFIDQGSDDETPKWIEENTDFFILLSKNIGITKGIELAAKTLEKYDFDLVIKLDNDVEIITESIIEHIKKFYSENGFNFVLSPKDTTIDPRYMPKSFGREKFGEYSFLNTTHTGGAFLVMPRKAFYDLLPLKRKEDMDIGGYFRKLGYKTGYLENLGIIHLGLNQSTPHGKYIF